MGARFEPYLKMLQSDDTGVGGDQEQDYRILFQPCEVIENINKQRIELKDPNTLFDWIMKDFETHDNSDYDDCLIQDIPTTGDPLQDVIDTPIEENKEFQEPEKRMEVDIAQVARWCVILKSSTNSLNEIDLIELFSLSDLEFDQIFVHVEDLSLHVLETAIMFLQSNTGVVPSRKIESLAHRGLLPKMLNDKLPRCEFLQSIFPLYQKLMDIQPHAVVKRILLPMFQRKVTIRPPLLKGIDKYEFLGAILSWMDEESIDLSSSSTQTLQQLFEGQRSLEDRYYEIIIKLLEQSFLLQPSDTNLAFFFRSVVQAFGPSFKRDHFKKIQTINDYNQTQMKQSIQAVIDKYSTEL